MHLDAVKEKKWYQLSGEEGLKQLGSAPEGLSSSEAALRLEKYGPNKLGDEQATSPLRVFLNQFKNPLIYILLLAAAVTASLGLFKDSVVILVVILINSIIGSWQELRAEQSLRALQKLSVPRARVLRNGEEVEVDSAALVPGDVVVLASGDKVPADLRLIAAKELRVEEATLTGESLPVTKKTDPIHEEGLTQGDQTNMVFMGTVVVNGRGRGLVVATGAHTVLGQIAENVRGVSLTKTPLQERFDRFAKRLGLVVLGLCVLLFAVGFALGMEKLELFMTAVAMSVAMIPEGLPVVVTITLAIGVSRMAKRNAIIRKLHAVETLGCTTVICSDKTGTLTRNEMTVKAIYDGHDDYEVMGSGYDPVGEIRHGDMDAGPLEIRPGSNLEMALRIGLLCNESTLVKQDGSYTVKGDPTEGALIVAALKAGLDLEKERREYTQLSIIPFESDRGYMATLHQHGGKRLVFIKGAPEKLLHFCSLELSPEECRMPDLLRASEEYGRRGLRVLALGWKEVPPHLTQKKELDEEMTHGVMLAGLQAIIDPPRVEAVQAVSDLSQAGIRTVMITGDHAITALAISERLGIGGRDPHVLTGRDIEEITDEQLREKVAGISVYARVSPTHKLRIARQFIQRGEIVAMTGDGVNDAPALKAAHIGIAMGKTGTDVAKEAAHMVLTDDNFASIAGAVYEGRVVFENIRKVTLYLIGGGLAILLTILGTLLLGIPLPFNPTQIIWLNFVTSALQDISLAFEPGERELLKVPPRSPDEGILSNTLIRRILVAGVTIALGTLASYGWALRSGSSLEEARTIAVTTVVFFQLFQVLNSRSLSLSVFKIGLAGNPLLILTMVVALVAHMAVVYVPQLEWLVRTTPLSADTLSAILLLALSVVLTVEMDKLFLRRARLSIRTS
ncbi:MAG: ATPase, P-type (transporting), superfamily, subfamily [Deltaproteobacteria bacterium]|nr:ATPase, P-type (transporting), superfamily, subfamily [Deltaproteobacteria bacterium]